MQQQGGKAVQTGDDTLQGLLLVSAEPQWASASCRTEFSRRGVEQLAANIAALLQRSQTGTPVCMQSRQFSCIVPCAITHTFNQGVQSGCPFWYAFTRFHQARGVQLPAFPSRCERSAGAQCSGQCSSQHLTQRVTVIFSRPQQQLKQIPVEYRSGVNQFIGAPQLRMRDIAVFSNRNQHPNHPSASEGNPYADTGL